jgi:choice-of-anchor B domain-containing protein
VNFKAADTPSVSRLSRAVGALSLALVLTQGGVVSSHVVEHGEVHATLQALVEQGAISHTVYVHIHRLYDTGKVNQLSRYLEGLADREEITAFLHVYLQTLLAVTVPVAALSAPAPANYSGNGIVTRLGQLNPYAPFPYYGDVAGGQLYEGVWGYAAAGREYALLTHSQGVVIIDVTDPTNPVALQFIPGVGGRVHHDIDTYEDPASGRTYAYFGGQENEHLFSIDLSYLPGTIPGSAIRDLGRTNYAHTLQVKDGLLFTNGAGSRGCQVFDVQANPANPPLLAQSWRGTGRDCHDSFSRNNLLYSADGYSTQWRIVDIGGIRSGAPPTLIGETAAKPGMYAHSGWLSDDSRYLFTFEESNVEDINVFDVSNPSAPLNVKTFQWSGDATAKSKVHNGQVKGNLLYVAYYDAGFRVFDIANPLNPIEVGKYETWRDPDGDGTFNRPVTGKYNGAWNVYTELPSGNILASDMLSGLFVFSVTPSAVPEAPSGLVAVPENVAVRLSWSPSSRATAYNVKRGQVPGGPYTLVLTGATATNFRDTGLTNGTRYYYVVSAVNAAGESPHSNEASATPSDGLTPPLGRDLVEVVVSNPPAFVGPGTAFNVTNTVRNEGTLDAGNSVSRYYLSRDAVKDTTDRRLNGKRAVPALPAGIASSGTVSVTVPATMPVGTYRLFACADDTKIVQEVLEGNNCTAAATTVVVALPDLVETALSTPAAAVSPGAGFTVSDTVRNTSSTVTAAASTTRYYFSADVTKDAGDVRLTGARGVPSLAAGGTSTGGRTVTTPTATAVGTYYVLGCTDDLLKVRETSETNNCVASATRLSVAWPDLVTTSVSNPPAGAVPGSKFTITDTVMNRGAAPASSSTTRYYLSVDGVTNAADVLLTGARSVAGLQSNAASTGSKIVTVPTSAPPGTYVVLACADDLAKVGEGNNANNCRASAMSVVIHP